MVSSVKNFLSIFSMIEIDPEILVKIRRIASRMARTPQGKHFHIDDIEQEGRIGFLLAQKRFDPSTGNKLWTYCEPRVFGQILDYFRFYSPGKRWKDDLKRGVNSPKPVIVSYEELTEEDGTKDLNDQLRYSPDRKTLFSKLFDSDFEPDNFFLVQCAVYKLPPQHANVLIRYYWLDYTMKEIGEQLNVTESYISQMITRTLRRLKKYLENPEMLYNINKSDVEELFSIIKLEQKRRYKMNIGKPKEDIIKETLAAIEECSSISEVALKLGIKDKMVVTRMRNYTECGDAGKKKGWYKPRMSKKKKLALVQGIPLNHFENPSLASQTEGLNFKGTPTSEESLKKKELAEKTPPAKKELTMEEIREIVKNYGKEVSQTNKNVLFGIEGVFTFFNTPYIVKISIEKGVKQGA